MGQLDQEIFIPKTFADAPTPEVFQAEQELMLHLLQLLHDPKVQNSPLLQKECFPGWGQVCLAELLLDPDLMGENTVPLLKVCKYLYQQGDAQALGIFFLRARRHLRPFAVKQGWIQEGEEINLSSPKLVAELREFIEGIGLNYLIPRIKTVSRS